MHIFRRSDRRSHARRSHARRGFRAPGRALFAVLALGSGLFSVASSSVSYAAPGDGVAAYISPPFVQGPPSSFGATLETFDSWTLAPENAPLTSFTGAQGVGASVGTFSGKTAIIDGVPNGVDYGGASVTTDTPTVAGTGTKFAQALGPGNTLSVTFTANQEARYVGFWWSAGSANDTVKFYSPADNVNPIATFTTATLNTLLGGQPNPFPGAATVSSIDGSQYKKGYYYGAPKYYSTTTPTVAAGPAQPFAYLNIYASGTIKFSRVEFQGPNFEFDNLAISTSLQTPPGNQVLIQSVLGKSVDFRANGGAGVMPAQTSDTATSLSPNAFTRAGYTFAGWHTTDSGSGGTDYVNGASYGFGADLTLYAQWTANSLTVTYDAQGGSSVASGSTTTGGSLSSVPGAPTRSGYIFNGWFTAASGGTALTFPYTHNQTADFTLYAQWTVDPNAAPAETSTTSTTSTTVTTVAEMTTTTSVAVTSTTVAEVGSASQSRPARAVALPTTGGSSSGLVRFAAVMILLGTAVTGVRRRFASREI